MENQNGQRKTRTEKIFSMSNAYRNRHPLYIWRTTNKLTQKEAAIALGYKSGSPLGYYERGDRGTPKEVLDRLDRVIEAKSNEAK